MYEYEIIDNMVKALGSIRAGVVVKDFLGKDYTYNFTPGIVSSDFELWTTVNAFPAYFVNSKHFGYEWMPARRFKGTSEFVISIYVRHMHDVEKMLSMAIKDVTMALMQDVTRGGLGTATFPQGHDTETRKYVPFGLCEMNVVVLYHSGS